MKKALSVCIWIMVGLLGAASYAAIAVYRGEGLNAVWILCAALCTYAIGYRFYSSWIAAKILTLDDRRATPCEVHEDGRDFVKTNKWIVFGHHFAAISGPGPLVGPVLAAQFGYLPGTLWILIGVVLGGAVQDFFILFASIRRNGKSVGEMVKEEIGVPAGIVAMTAIVCIIIILIAVLGLIIVKALAHSPWGTFTIAATMPIALFMGIYLRFIRPGKVLEVTVIGVALLLLSVYGGKFFHEIPELAKILTFDGPTLAWMVIGYGLAASVLPVWLLLAPRDYLSTFMKLGTIGALALGIFLVLPSLTMPALTRFVDGTGPVFSGNVFPFCFITIACGAISGFHSLIASGTTPKLITRESHARAIGYGSMLLESFVAIMALIAACTLSPGQYFAMNGAASIVGSTPEQITQTISGWGYPVSVSEMEALAKSLGETTMFGRAGGAPTLAVGMAHIFSKLTGPAFLSLWYHFAIMFEALFILTTVDAGTRVGRFLIQALFGQIWKPLGNTHSYGANLFGSVILVSAWGYFLYSGVTDPLGGINSLWPLFGIANQLLALVALCLATTLLIKMGKTRFIWITLIPLLWLTAVTFTAGLEKIFHPDPRIGFLSMADTLSGKLASGGLNAANIATTKRVIFNMQLDALVAGTFLFLVGAILILSAIRWIGLVLGRYVADLKETPPVWLTPETLAAEAAAGPAWKFWAVGLFAMEMLRHLSGQNKLDSRTLTQSAGAEWASREEARFKNPRCC
ncbi:MAG: carbon starvation protein A [Leptospirales bacterium]|nr:carbon starvation protein A [Leptospirales bacterium]